MNGGAVKVSIIIVSFNAREILRDCLVSIRRAELGFNYEIIIVDNNSIDGSCEMVREEYPDLMLVANDQNKLFAAANNQGADLASGEYLLLLNSDTLVDRGNIEKLVRFLDDAPSKIACVGPVVLNDDKSRQSAGYALPSIAERISMVLYLNRLLPRFIARRVLPAGIPGLYEADHQVGWISGCCMLIRSDVYKAFGGLNEALEFYGEEPEFCMRLDRKGYETWLVHDATIVHLGGKSSGQEYAPFLHDQVGAMRRYSTLQQHTVGLRTSIIMSRIVLATAWIKYLLFGKKTRAYFRMAIANEKAVIAYMKKLL
ncbi:MAG: glycosyltransferase family 2 protein [Chlorobiaceae bacterium]|nr:glycosyltransferase family 2 protein [Chlorobiaceae bacterium]NTW73717.1 glycosyltransferase family 2 protein [Chlorobiaceae bacterium]